jgi:Trk K+ transport system NAD-binding subunit
MRKTFLIVVSLAGALMLAGVIVFRHALNLSWLDAVYFVVTTMTTVGYGDINLQHAPAGAKVFGILLMLSSAALLAATFGFITDFVLKTHLDQLFGRRRLRMKDHIVLCGLGHVGIRVLEQLQRLGEPVVVIEKDENNRFLDAARAQGVPLVLSDVRLPSALERANVRQARSIIVATDNDLVNLEVALNAREARPDIRVVLRIFDHSLAAKIRSGFGIKTTFSTSALAAPAFAMAAVDPAVVGSFYVGENLMLVLNLVVAPGAELDGATVHDVAQRAGVGVLCHESPAGERQLHPPATVAVRAGDKITVSAAPEVCPRIRAMSAPR